ncbi:Ribose/galactose isomerase [Neoconidiobolus thromboides FSU 785]|nr:Ribose/galactose isomerase [Neoconidiobolus thromboides FSU 785]
MSELPKTIIIGSDHAGYQLKEEIKKYFEENNKNIKVMDYGTHSGDRCDYPDIAGKVSEAVLKEADSKGILICGSGIGISIAANKINGIRCALCHNEYTAEMARKHNDANILAMGQRVLEGDMPIKIVKTFFANTFEGNQHKTRVDKIHQLEN